MHSFTSIIALGLDSFLACAVLGMLSLNGRERLRLTFAFGTADALATRLGPVVTHQSLSHPLLFRSPILNWSAFTLSGLCSVGIFALAALLFLRAPRRPRSLLYIAPLLCSLDNLFAGNPPDNAPLAGLSSACLALAGLAVGLGCRNLVSRSAEEA